MIDLKKISGIYFLGIAGIGMSALARYFKEKGVSVSGYDKTETTLSRQLQSEGIKINYTDDINLLDKNAELIIYTPAIPEGNLQYAFYQNNNYSLLKRSEVLGEITKGNYNICVAGTHGKTTISAMIAHILRDTGFGCNAFLGGISVNYNTNFWSSTNDVYVAEADEYDRSFLQLAPDVAIITAMDADHLDIYGTGEAVENAFVQFSKKIKEGGLLLSKHGLRKDKELSASHHLRYSLQNDAADIYAKNITMSNGSYTFDVMATDWTIDNIILNMGGMHNVENAVAAIAVASYLKIDSEKIKLAIQNFKGVKRRFEYIIPPSVSNNKTIFIDDYAHHPEELKALINGAKTLFPGRRCTVVFQPHLFTRTKDFAKEFAETLNLADEVILLPIYPARELPIEGVSSNIILDKMKIENKSVKTKDELLAYLKSSEIIFNDEEFGALFITAGAGDIDTLIDPIKQIALKN